MSIKKANGSELETNLELPLERLGFKIDAQLFYDLKAHLGRNKIKMREFFEPLIRAEIDKSNKPG